VDLSVPARASLARSSRIGPWCAALLAAGAALLAACSGSSRSAITPPVGTTTGVVLSSSTGTTQLQQGASLVLTATVTNDVNNAGVTWVLSGAGALTGQTTTTATYTAPATGITGTTNPVITATSNADSTKNATATLIVLGTPVIDPPALFPANVGSPYGANVTVAGGLAPFTWALASGTLPPGLTLGTTSTTSFSALSGTPTTAGSYDFQVQVTDSNKIVAVASISNFVVKPAAACLLEGQYALLYTGYANNVPAVGATSLTVSSAGTITGFHDFNAGASPVAETLTGSCTTRTSNNGTLTLTGAANSPVYDYAVTTALDKGRIQLLNGGDNQSGTGLFFTQSAPFTLSLLAGNFAFGALGAGADGTRLGIAGAVAIDMNGAVTSGQMDANGASPLTDAALAGSLSAPDANGRGTITLTATGAGGSRTFHFAYYWITADRLMIVSTDTAPRLAGFMTRQAGSFGSASLASPGILTLWGADTSATLSPGAPKAVLMIGRLANADATSGTIDLTADTADHLTAAIGQVTPGLAYSVRAADGRTTLNYTSGTPLRQFVLYLDGVASGYVIEQSSATGNAGLLEAQIGPFSTAVPGFFVGGTQYPQDIAPMVLLPAVFLANGTFSASSASGFYALDATIGHGSGTITVTGSGASIYSLYLVNPNKVVTLRFGSVNRSAVIDWLGSN
jgi:large repetitive protein